MHSHLQDQQIIQAIKSGAHPIKGETSFTPLLSALAEAKIVMLGEATHGTEEFYRLRSQMTERLLRDYGFSFVAVEGDWPDCYKLHEFLSHPKHQQVSSILAQFHRWPTWLWANQATADFLDGIRGHDFGFFGLDVYSLYDSLERVKTYAAKLGQEFYDQLIPSYAGFERYQGNEIDYAKAVIRWPDQSEDQIRKILRQVLRIRLNHSGVDRRELFDMQQNARVIRNAERFYRAMLVGGPSSWNIRDEHMLQTLNSLLAYYGNGAKAIVWAHNSHIGDYHATDMSKDGYVNLGGLAREEHGMEKVALVGFGTYQGQVLAARAWESLPKPMDLPPAKADSIENCFHRAAEEMLMPNFYLRTRDRSALHIQKGHRAVGVVYDPTFEAHGRNYVASDLADRYDYFVHFDQTTALKALPATLAAGLLPETWPTGT